VNFTASTWTQWNRLYTTASAGGSGVVETLIVTDDVSMTTAIASQKIWTAWNRTYTTTGWTDAGTTNGCSTCTTLIEDPWGAWNRHYISSLRSGRASYGEANAAPPAPETPTQVQAREQRRIADRERWIQIEGERALARERAQRILQENLTLAQREELAQKGHFTLTLYAGDERRLYRIRQGRSRNVHQVDDNGRILKTLCAHPGIDCPDEDTMLAQKLMLESQEQEFLRIANHS
jgi:hypothetical protein